MSEPQPANIQNNQTSERHNVKEESKKTQRVYLSPERESEDDDEITSSYVRGYN